jgi:predicted nuclease of predicted toxin-antitoxin system
VRCGLTFFFDNTFPPQIAKILNILGVETRHLQDEFPAETNDIDCMLIRLTAPEA